MWCMEGENVNSEDWVQNWTFYLKLTGEKQSQKIIVVSLQCLTHREQTLQKHKNGGSNIHRGKWRNRKQQGTQMELIRENKTKEVGKPK